MTGATGATGATGETGSVALPVHLAGSMTVLAGNSIGSASVTCPEGTFAISGAYALSNNGWFCLRSINADALDSGDGQKTLSRSWLFTIAGPAQPAEFTVRIAVMCVPLA